MTTRRIHQLQVAYKQTEDRLLLRFNTSDGAEFRFWLTRFFVKQFWPGLRGAMGVKTTGQDSAPIPDDIAGFMHQSAVEQADFATEFVPSTAPCPLGEEPILVCRAAIRSNGAGAFILSLYPEQGLGVELGVDQNLLHLLSKLIHDAVAKEEWGLEIRLPGAAADSLAGAAVATGRGRRLH